MANITINEISQNYTYNIGRNSYATVALPITAAWGPGYSYSNSSALDLDSESLENSVWTRFAANQQGLEAFVAAYRGPATQYLKRKDFSYQMGMTLLTAGYDVLVCRISGGDKASGEALFDSGSLGISAKYAGTFGNSLSVNIKKVVVHQLTYWNIVTYIVDKNSHVRTAVENLNFVFDIEKSTDAVLHISEVDSNFLVFDTSSAPTVDTVELLDEFDEDDQTHSWDSAYLVQSIQLQGGTDHPELGEEVSEELEAALADANAAKDVALASKEVAFALHTEALNLKTASDISAEAVENANVAKNTANENAQAAKTTANELKAVANEAKAVLDTARAELDAAREAHEANPDDQEAAEAYQAAEEAYQAAADDYSAKKAAYDAAKATYEELKAAYEALRDAYNDAVAAHQADVEAYQAKKAEYETAKAQYETDKADYETKKAIYEAKKAVFDSTIIQMYMEAAVKCAQNRYSHSLENQEYYSGESESVDNTCYIQLLQSVAGEITDKNVAKAICQREWMFNAAYSVLGALTDKLAYNPNRIIVPGWDDQDLLFLDPDLFNQDFDERVFKVNRVSPLHQRLMDIAYYSRCATAYIDIPKSLEKREVYEDLAKGIEGYAQMLSRTYEKRANVVNGAFYSTHSALFAPWGKYTYVGMGKQMQASPSFLALLIDRAMILNQTSQYEWELPTNRRHNLKIGKMDYTISKKYLDIWQSLEGVGVNCITQIPDLGLSIWGNSTLYEVPPATYQALANLSTRKLINAVEDLAYRCGIAITFQYNNEQAYNAFYAGMVPLLDTMRNVGAIEDYYLRMAEDVNGLDQVNANSVVGKIYLVIKGVINDITIDLIALPPQTDLNQFRI